jgi:hypothetical protein
VGVVDVEDLRRIRAWFAGEGDKKGDYKLPHHKADGYATVWRGVAAAMGALLGARGGVQIPDSDKRGVYGHLAKHYAQFDKEPPEFKEYGQADLALIALGLEPLVLSEADMLVALKMEMEAMTASVRTLFEHCADMNPWAGRADPTSTPWRWTRTGVPRVPTAPRGRP